MTNQHMEKKIQELRAGLPKETRAALARQASRVEAFVLALGGYNAQVTVRCGTLGIPRTGTLAPATTPDQWPHVVTADGKHFQVCPATTPEKSS